MQCFALVSSRRCMNRVHGRSRHCGSHQRKKYTCDADGVFRQYSVSSSHSGLAAIIPRLVADPRFIDVLTAITSNKEGVLRRIISVDGRFTSGRKMVEFCAANGLKGVRLGIFAAVCAYMNRTNLVVRLQSVVRRWLAQQASGVTVRLIRRMMLMRQKIRQIIFIQRWVRCWMMRRRIWGRDASRIVSYMAKKIIPNLPSIIKIQRFVRSVVHERVQRIHPCPYTGEAGWEIPKEQRTTIIHIVHTENQTRKHLRRYNLIWLHEDMLHQSRTRQQMIEPSTRQIMDDALVVGIARRAWVCTRIYGRFLYKKPGPYERSRDWLDPNNHTEIRSIYCISMLLFDTAFCLGLSPDEVHPERLWRIGRRNEYVISLLDIMQDVVSTVRLGGRDPEIMDFVASIGYVLDPAFLFYPENETFFIGEFFLIIYELANVARVKIDLRHVCDKITRLLQT